MRTFIAVDVTARDTISKLQYDIISNARWGPRAVKPVEVQNFHFTMIFLGEVNDVDRIIRKIEELEFEPFTITYQSIGAFPNSNMAKIIWIGVDKTSEQKLSNLANNIITKMMEIGFSADKPFSPHMTLFRVKGSPVKADNILAKYKYRIFGEDIIDKVHLKKSDLKSSGPTYSNIYTLEAKKL